MDWKKTLTVPVLSAGLVFSAFSPSISFAQGTGAEDGNALAEASLIKSHYENGPFDIGLANDDMLLKSLIKQGIIDHSASPKDQRQALKAYLQQRAEEAQKKANNTPKEQKLARRSLQKKAGIQPKTVNKTNVNGAQHPDKQWKPGQLPAQPGSIKREEWNGKVRHDKVLVLLIQYPNFPHNQIKPEDDPVLLYQDFNLNHYRSMIFGNNGYVGPDGQNLISVNQFYHQQSGGSYDIAGNVYGWYTAKHNAAYYGGNDENGNDGHPRQLVVEALQDAAANGVKLNQYDQEDPYDIDGDGNIREPDGLVDHLMIIHSGVGEEAGGGALGPDAIWSHSWSLPGPTAIPGTTAEVPYWGGQIAGYDYTIEPEDGAAGVFAHEYGHDLGLPDEYDIAYSTGYGSTVGYWSVMASGSWTGKIPGTEPSGFGAYDKEILQSEMPESNWFKDQVLNFSDLSSTNQTFKLDEASVKGTNLDAVRVNLPKKHTTVNTPASGSYEYFSGSGNNLNHSMVTTVDLTNAKAANLSFKAWYDIEQNWDYASIQVKQDGNWVSIPGNITTQEDPYGQNPGYGITGSSNGWIDAQFDLSAYVGQSLTLRINYWTDGAAVHSGLYVDDIQVTADGNQLLSDGAESADSAFDLQGFQRDQGVRSTSHYYLLEWRNWEAADSGLAHIRRGDSLMTYDPGLVIWYVDNKYSDNIGLLHPGHGFLGVVDAHQNLATWSDGVIASNSYQVQDAAFSMQKTDDMYLDYTHYYDGLYLEENSQPSKALYDDHFNNYDEKNPYIGLKIPDYGLKVRVIGQSEDNTVGA
ncbi:MAG TPA: immune inhibitor A domain-containing protein, partial [Bacillales bacterium]|nr:immune inhibitor A domain-containing protein [Bacillales bacterium]